MIHWLHITVDRSLNRDIEFLLKLPLIPNRHLSELEEYTIALYRSNSKPQSYLLKTDSDVFFHSYRPYYEKRFKTELPDRFYQMPAGYELYFGWDHSDDKPPASLAEPEAESEKS